MSNKTPLALFNGSFIGPKPTGIGVVARDLSRELDPDLVQVLDPIGNICPNSIPIPSNLMPELGIKGHLRRLLWTQLKLPDLIKRTGAELLFSPVPEAPVCRGVRSVVLAHDLLPLRYPRPSPLLAYHLAYVPLVLHKSIKILCNSHATARELHEKLFIPIDKLIVIPLGFNSKKIYPLDIKREPFFLILGRHDPHKNIARTLYAFSLIENPDVQLWIVGPQDHRYTPKLKKLAVELQIDQRCRWISWVSDKERLRLLNSCMGLLFASLWEGFGLPALEAMACKTPVIASMTGALPEVVGDAGLLVNPFEPFSIADAMKQIISDSSLRNNLVSNGIERVKNYQWKKSAYIIESILKDLRN